MPSNISVPGAVAIAILVVLVLIVIVRNIYIVQQSKAYVVERLGAFHSVWGVGFHLKVPFIERVVKKVSLKEQVADFDPQPVITKDNVTMQIDTVIYFQITDPKLYTYGVEYPMNAIENLTATTLRNIIGELELDQSLTSRDTINAKMRTILDEATDPWGIKVNRVELKNILPPREIQNAMEKQMKAERERRESILQAEGQKQSQILVAEGEKQSTILRADAAKQAKIMAAEAEATSILKVQQALADYDNVELQYRTYSRTWMQEEDSPFYIPVDRLEVLDLLDTASDTIYWADTGFVSPFSDKVEVTLPYGLTEYVNRTQTERKNNTGTGRTSINVVLSGRCDLIAPAGGKVLLAEKLPNVGNTLVIEHGAGVKTIYYGLRRLTVEKGAIVAQGDALGTTDKATVVEVRVGKTPVEPLRILRGQCDALRSY